MCVYVYLCVCGVYMCVYVCMYVWCVCVCARAHVRTYIHLRDQNPLELGLQMVVNHLIWVLGIKLPQ